jgi:hypothetical protein
MYGKPESGISRYPNPGFKNLTCPLFLMPLAKKPGDQQHAANQRNGKDCIDHQWPDRLINGWLWIHINGLCLFYSPAGHDHDS